LFVSLGDKCPLTQSQRLQYLIIYNSFGIIRFLRELKMARSSIIVYDILTIACNNKIKGQFYCVVFLFCFSSSCVPYVASFFGLSIFDLLNDTLIYRPPMALICQGNVSSLCPQFSGTPVLTH
jgi:hypothetical protein